MSKPYLDDTLAHLFPFFKVLLMDPIHHPRCYHPLVGDEEGERERDRESAREKARGYAREQARQKKRVLVCVCMRVCETFTASSRGTATARRQQKQPAQEARHAAMHVTSESAVRRSDEHANEAGSTHTRTMAAKASVPPWLNFAIHQSAVPVSPSRFLAAIFFCANVFFFFLTSSCFPAIQIQTNPTCI